MGYNVNNYKRIKQEFSEKHFRAIDLAEIREAELHAKFPDLVSIDRALSETGFKIIDAASCYSGERLEEEINRLKDENLALQNDRAEFLKANGYPADYTSPRFDCHICKDTGYDGIKMCQCMREALAMAGYESSGIGRLIEMQSFDSFEPSYQAEDSRAHETLKSILAICREYSEQFPDFKYKCLLFIGATGLGKTHLSTAIAKRVIERGHDVVYDTAQNIFSDFEYERFGRSYNNVEEPRTSKYFDCDLLIIDDLGTELTNQFTISCLYNIINTRINNGKGIIINTNLSKDELRKRYADRITSRLFGEFLPLLFLGRDVREKKLENRN